MQVIIHNKGCLPNSKNVLCDVCVMSMWVLLCCGYCMRRLHALTLIEEEEEEEEKENRSIEREDRKRKMSA